MDGLQKLILGLLNSCFSTLVITVPAIIAICAVCGFEMVGVPLWFGVPIATMLASIAFSLFVESTRYRCKFCPRDGESLIPLSEFETNLATDVRVPGDMYWQRVFTMNAVGVMCAIASALLAEDLSYGAAMMGYFAIVIGVSTLFAWLDPKFGKQYLERARAQWADGDLNLAIRDFSEARILWSALTYDAISARGEIFLELGYYEQAREDFREACRFAHRHTELHKWCRTVRKAEFCANFDDPEEADAAWRTYEEIEKESMHKAADFMASVLS